MSEVFFIKDPARAGKLFEKISAVISKGGRAALKIHFGEPGNDAHLKPKDVDPIYDKIKALGAIPFYTDANTLYKGVREETASHLKNAAKQGFKNVEISEEADFVEVDLDLKHLKKFYIAGAAARADALVSLAHFKGHNVTGFGGAIKNIGMGLGTRRGKLDMHSDCENCAKKEACWKKQTIDPCWTGSSILVQEKMAEYAAAVIKTKKGKVACLNFLTIVSPNCDCYDSCDPPIVPDIGVLASFDPVAIDQASVDLINQAEGRIKSRNKFRALYPNVDWSIQLKYAEKIKLGNRKYSLSEI